MKPSLASRLIARAQAALDHARVAALPDSDKRAILRLCQAVALVDGELAAHEQESMQALTKRLGLSWADAGEQSIDAAVKHLAAHPRVLSLACLLVADAVFADGDYDDAEQKFVASFQQRFGLPTNPLRDAVETLRKHKLDAALSAWNDEIRAH